MDDRFLGVDFSGGAKPWQPRCTRPTVWIATIDDDTLSDLRPVQALSGTGDPFDRLVAMLASGKFRAAGIDAPFCIPARHMPTGGHLALLSAVAAMDTADDRPFPPGASLVNFVVEVAPLQRLKPLRATEQYWFAQGVNVRSTLWNGPRGGAAFTSACLTLLARCGRPVWPWNDGPGMLVEAFPAGQLRRWGLPFTRYADSMDRAVREAIVSDVEIRIRVPQDMRVVMLDSPDALDAVLASFGAMAAARGNLAIPLPQDWKVEGAIAIHS